MTPRKFQATPFEWGLIICFSFVILFLPNLIFPFLIVTLLYFLSKSNKKKRPLGIRVLRVLYAMCGIAAFPILHFGPQAYVNLQLEQRHFIGEGPYIFFLDVYKIYFIVIFPTLSYLSAYFLTSMDSGGYILPIITFGIATLIMLIAISLSGAFMTPFFMIFLILLMLHIIYFSRPRIKKMFMHDDVPLGLHMFHYLYGVIAFIYLQVAWYSIENMHQFANPVTGLYEKGRLELDVMFAVFCLLSSSLLYRKNVWGYRIPIFLLALAILMNMVVIYMPILLAHVVYFNLPGTKARLKWQP